MSTPPPQPHPRVRNRRLRNIAAWHCQRTSSPRFLEHEGISAIPCRLGRPVVAAVVRAERVPLPRATVLDVGIIQGRGWAVVELNAAWGAGIYGCDPGAVLDVVRYAAVRALQGIGED